MPPIETPLAFDLPDELIATAPAQPRDHSRLLVAPQDPSEKAPIEALFRDLPNFLRARDLLIVNQSRVIPARLYVRLMDGKLCEVLLLELQGPLTWTCLIKGSRRFRRPTEVQLPDGVRAIVSPGLPFRTIQFQGVAEDAFWTWLDRVGEVPLPPYIRRPAAPEDRLSYQCVFAEERGSVAAPTAGLHFTVELMQRLKAMHIQCCSVTLHVGYGTFAPIRGAIQDHKMHTERYSVHPSVFQAIEETRKNGGRVIAVGTTTVRALEAAQGGTLSGSTDIFIQPGHVFHTIDGLITNFHLPDSTLLLLVQAFGGSEDVLDLYRFAIEKRYRFYSYGDAMLLWRRSHSA